MIEKEVIVSPPKKKPRLSLTNLMFLGIGILLGRLSCSTNCTAMAMELNKKLQTVDNDYESSPQQEVAEKSNLVQNSSKGSNDFLAINQTTKVVVEGSIGGGGLKSSNIGHGHESSSSSVVNIMYTLSGNNTDFFKEFTTSLKSVLFNAPLDDEMVIHIMADKKAYNQLGPTFFEIMKFQNFTSRNQISIKTYMVEESINYWRHFIQNTTGASVNMMHSIGAFFRLFAHDFLPKNVEHVLYMDTDVAVLANLQELWRLRNHSTMFQWGESRCSGFVLINLPSWKENFWKSLQKIGKASLSNSSFTTHRGSIDDQSLLREVFDKFPDFVSLIPDSWDNTWAYGVWRWRKVDHLLRERPEVGMIHLNGGGGSLNSAFDDSSAIKDEAYKEMWQVPVGYYNKILWPWAKFFLQSQSRDGIGFPISIEYNQQ